MRGKLEFESIVAFEGPTKPPYSKGRRYTSDAALIPGKRSWIVLMWSGAWTVGVASIRYIMVRQIGGSIMWRLCWLESTNGDAFITHIESLASEKNNRGGRPPIWILGSHLPVSEVRRCIEKHK